MGAEREAAYNALLEYRKSRVWPDLYLKKKLEPLDRQQASLATAITYGVIQNSLLIDYYISSFSSIKLNKISPYVLESMRMAVYQMLFLDRVPDSAAVNEAVKLINKGGNKRAAGFANGVLRAIARQKDALPEIKGKRDEKLSIKYSHPLWLTRRFIKILGEEGAEKLLAADNSGADAVVRVNTLKSSDEDFIAAYTSLCGSSPSPVNGVEHAFYAPDIALLLKSHEFANGRFYVQDTASQLAVKVLSPQRGERLLDICAAPGGKSLLAAQYMENDGEIVSNDVYPHKRDIIKANAERYGASLITATCKDGSLFCPEEDGMYDRIICDAPCSGLGIIRKKPDIRYKDPIELKGLPDIQKKLLESAASCLRPGGRMIYTTCTVLPEENEGVLNAFLAEHEEYHLVPFELPGRQTEGYVTLFPHMDGTDGFFISLLERRA